MNLTSTLQQYIDHLSPAIEQISHERKGVLQDVVGYVKSSKHPKLNFICTHNSRRSHLGQVWAQTAASFYGVDLNSYSGGTEATAFNPNAIAALKRAGFNISGSQGDNPQYEVRFSDDEAPMICFSKKYDEEPNPKKDFAAIMTCSEADLECPFIPGAAKRIKLLYEDPKVADGTSEQELKYDERCSQIATEMFYVFSQIK